MGRSTIACCGLLASLVFASGCGTTGRMNPMAWIRNSQRSLAEDGKKLATHNPFKKKTNQYSEEAIGRRQTEKEGDQVADSRDTDIKQFIADELKDATPEERAELMADLQSLDPQLARQILKLRRMRIQLEQERQQLAQNPASDPNQPMRGLGAPFPGSGRRADSAAQTLPGQSNGQFADNEQRQLADRRPEIGSGSNSRATSNVKFSQFNQQDFGHSQTKSTNVSATNADSRAFSPSELRPDRRDLSGAESYQARNPELTSQSIRERADNLPARGADSAVSQPDNPTLALDRRPSAGGLQQPLRTPTSPNGFGRFGEQSIPSERRGNPLELTGIDTSPAYLQRDHIALPTGGRTNLDKTDVSAASANAALQQMIAVAEEQAHGSQIAWEQAEKIPPGSADDLSARDKTIAARKQDYIEKQVYLRLLYLMSGQQARSLERIIGLEPADQEFWTQMLWSMVNYFDVDGIPNPDERATETITQLRTAIQKLQENARLKIGNVNFCQKILSYGNYETFESDKFRPKQSVLIYAEIENFASERRTDGMYRTQLKSTIEIRKGGQQGGEAIKTIEFDATTDLCRNHRHDYFHSYELQIPAGLQGSYVLVLLVEDQLSKRVSSYSRNFTVE